MQIIVEECQKIFDALKSLENKTGVIEFSTYIEYVLPVKKYKSCIIEEWMEDGVPMTYKLLFTNEADEEDFIEFWDNKISTVEYADLTKWENNKVKQVFTLIIDDDEDQAIRFYIED